MVWMASLLASMAAPGPTSEDNVVHDRLIEVARNYKSWGRLDDVARWTPVPCTDAGDSRVKKPAGYSGAKEGAHESKLYFLYAKDAKAYQNMDWATPSPVGQALVKEAFHPVEVLEDAEGIKARDISGKHYQAGAPQGLYVMVKLEVGTPDTDDGWAYGVIDPDGTVKEAGVIPSCQSCHHGTKTDHLYGVGGRR